MKRSSDLIAGWTVTTFFCVTMAMIFRPLMIPVFVLWFFITLPVVVELTRTARGRHRAIRRFKAAMSDPKMNRVAVILPPSSPHAVANEPSGMILLPPQDRDPRWMHAREWQQAQRSGQLHVVRDVRPLTDCPAGHYDYHELRESSLDRAVRRCAWCPPSAGTWTEGPMGSEDSER